METDEEVKRGARRVSAAKECSACALRSVGSIFRVTIRSDIAGYCL